MKKKNTMYTKFIVYFRLTITTERTDLIGQIIRRSFVVVVAAAVFFLFYNLIMIRPCYAVLC